MEIQKVQSSVRVKEIYTQSQQRERKTNKQRIKKKKATNILSRRIQKKSPNPKSTILVGREEFQRWSM